MRPALGGRGSHATLVLALLLFAGTPRKSEAILPIIAGAAAFLTPEAIAGASLLGGVLATRVAPRIPGLLQGASQLGQRGWNAAAPAVTNGFQRITNFVGRRGPAEVTREITDKIDDAFTARDIFETIGENPQVGVDPFLQGIRPGNTLGIFGEPPDMGRFDRDEATPPLSWGDQDPFQVGSADPVASQDPGLDAFGGSGDPVGQDAMPADQDAFPAGPQ